MNSYLPRPILFSILLHASFIGGMAYLSVQKSLPNGTLMDVIMIAPDTLATVSMVMSPTNNIIVAKDPETGKVSKRELDIEPVTPLVPNINIKAKKTVSTSTKKLPIKQKSTSGTDKIINQQVGTMVGSTVVSEMNLSSSQGVVVFSQSKPVYPERARAMGIEGKVIVKFDIDPGGRVININFVVAEPKNLFEREVKKVMVKWRYEPKAIVGLQKTILFKLTGDIALQ